MLEAFDGYWRKTPEREAAGLRVIPDEATRLAALKRGEVDIAYSIRGELAEELQRTPGLTLKPAVIQGTFWLDFPDQWDPKSPWHDRRVRQAAQPRDRPQGDQPGADARLLAGSPTASSPTASSSTGSRRRRSYDPAKAKKLLAEAGYPNGFDAGDYYCDASYANLAEAVLNNLQEVGIRVKLRPLERAAFFSGYAEKKLKNLIQGSSGAFGNAATRLEAFVVKGGAYVYGSYPEIDGLFAEQAAELDRQAHEAMLHRIQQLVHEKAIYAPIWELAFINGRAARRRIRPRPDPGPRLLGALRGRDAQEELNNTGSNPMRSFPRQHTATRRAHPGPCRARRRGPGNETGERRRTARSSTPRTSRWRRPGSIRRKRPASSLPSCCSTPCMTGW